MQDFRGHNVANKTTLILWHSGSGLQIVWKVLTPAQVPGQPTRSVEVLAQLQHSDSRHSCFLGQSMADGKKRMAAPFSTLALDVTTVCLLCLVAGPYYLDYSRVSVLC